MINLKQKELNEWQHRNFNNCFPEDMLIGMTEELGELAHAFLKHKQGIREYANGGDVKDKIADAFGDVIVYGCQLLSVLGIDAEKAIETTVTEVLNRDWVNNPAGIGESQHNK